MFYSSFVRYSSYDLYPPINPGMRPGCSLTATECTRRRGHHVTPKVKGMGNAIRERRENGAKLWGQNRAVRFVVVADGCM